MQNFCQFGTPTLGRLRAASKVLGSDLTTEYVKINADYRS
jgi:N-acetylglutamate synthase/N-acetylornithine aminotransferase